MQAIIDIEQYPTMVQFQVLLNQGYISTDNMNSLKGMIYYWDQDYRMVAHVDSKLGFQFQVLDTRKYLLMQNLRKISIFEKIGKLEIRQSPFEINMERINHVIYDERIECILTSYYYSAVVSLWSLRTFRELMRYQLKEYTNHVCLSRNQYKFYCGDFNGHLYRFNYIDTKFEKKKRIHKKAIVIGELRDQVVTCSENEIRMVNGEFRIIRRILLDDQFRNMVLNASMVVVVLKSGDLQVMDWLGRCKKRVQRPDENERILDLIGDRNMVFIRTQKQIYLLKND